MFLAGLFGSVIVFFVFCYGMGKVINNGDREAGRPDDEVEHAERLRARRRRTASGRTWPAIRRCEQKELQQMTATFPEPRLDIDDGNQATADLHAREDLLLNNYSVVDGSRERFGFRSIARWS